MPKFIPFPSIDQFRTVIANIISRTDYIGRDADNKPIYSRDLTKPRPKFVFTGTVKLHGTNAAVCMDDEGLWCQSRNNIITVTEDNAGFAKFVDSRNLYFTDLLKGLKIAHGLKTAVLFGEWCGGKIQKGVALTQLSTRFVFFGLYGSNQKDESVWLKIDDIPSSPDNMVFNIGVFPTWQMEIDFGSPKQSQNELAKLTDEVEKECPAGKYFGVSGLGEGIVWTHQYSPGEVYRFKVKGKAHSSSKVKTLATVDVERLNSVNEFVDYVCTESRLNQGLEQTFRLQNKEMHIKDMGAYIKWVVDDVEKEESDTLAANGLTLKETKSKISEKARNWFLAQWERL